MSPADRMRRASRRAAAAAVVVALLPGGGGAVPPRADSSHLAPTERAPAQAAQSARADAGEAYALIVNPSLGVTNVSLADARRIFLGEQQFWPGGGRVVLFVHAPGTPGRAVALRHLYQMREDEFRRYWIAKTFRGDVAGGPKIVSTDALARRLTASIPGAVTVIRASEVDSSVKVLSVDGRAPGDARYALLAGGR